MSPRKTSRAESELWKDKIDRSSMKRLADEFARAYRSFDRDAFMATIVTKHFLSLELKDRIMAVAEALHDLLPAEYSKAVFILIKVAPRVGMFENWILTTYVELFGLDHFDRSIDALAELTKSGTGEFAIRPFIIRDADRIMPVFHKWAEDPDEHIRRLAAEGSRPRGVWVAHIDCFKKDPTPVLKLLEKLKADPSLYVRKAVANNLNDISKENPDAVIRTAKKWKKDRNILTDWIIKRGCRSLIKQGDHNVLPIFGFAPNPKVALSRIKLPGAGVAVGDELIASFVIVSQGEKSQKLAIDYRLFFRKKKGDLNAKVFKYAEKTIKSGEKVGCTLKHKMRNFSTRRLYPGRHRLELVINGRTAGGKDFTLTE